MKYKIMKSTKGYFIKEKYYLFFWHIYRDINGYIRYFENLKSTENYIIEKEDIKNAIFIKGFY